MLHNCWLFEGNSFELVNTSPGDITGGCDVCNGRYPCPTPTPTAPLHKRLQ